MANFESESSKQFAGGLCPKNRGQVVARDEPSDNFAGTAGVLVDQQNHATVEMPGTESFGHVDDGFVDSSIAQNGSNDFPTGCRDLRVSRKRLFVVSLTPAKQRPAQAVRYRDRIRGEIPREPETPNTAAIIAAEIHNEAAAVGQFLNGCIKLPGDVEAKGSTKEGNSDHSNIRTDPLAGN